MALFSQLSAAVKKVVLKYIKQNLDSVLCSLTAQKSSQSKWAINKATADQLLMRRWRRVNQWGGALWCDKDDEDEETVERTLLWRPSDSDRTLTDWCCWRVVRKHRYPFHTQSRKNCWEDAGNTNSLEGRWQRQQQQHHHHPFRYFNQKMPCRRSPTVTLLGIADQLSTWDRQPAIMTQRSDVSDCCTMYEVTTTEGEEEQVLVTVSCDQLLRMSSSSASLPSPKSDQLGWFRLSCVNPKLDCV